MGLMPYFCPYTKPQGWGGWVVQLVEYLPHNCEDLKRHMKAGVTVWSLSTKEGETGGPRRSLASQLC